MKRLITIGFLLPLVLISCAQDQSPSSEPLAFVDGKAISLQQYQRSYRDYLFSGGLADEPMRRSAFLNRLIAVELITAEARDAGIEQTAEFQEARERARQKLLIEAFLADEIYADVEVTEEEVVDQFVRVNTQMTARHLFTPTLEKAQALKARLDSGEDFEVLAAEVFADPVLAESGGLIGTFGFDETDPAFEDAAFELRVGETSGPVRTSQGYSIIRLEDRFTKPIMTESEFAEKRPELEGHVRARKEAGARRAFLEELVEGASVTLNREVAASILGQTLGEMDEGARELVRFEIAGEERSWTPADLREAARFTSDRQRRSVDDMHDLTAFVEGLVARSIMLERASELGLGRDRRVREGLDAAMSEWIYEQAFNQLVEGMTLSEEDLRTHYEEYQEEFRLPRRVRISEIVTATAEDARALKEQAQSGSFASLAREHSLRPASAAEGGLVGIFSAEELGPWSGQVFAAQEGEVVGPLPAAGKYLILHVDEFLDPRPATFEEARADVERLLRRARQQEYLREHVQMLRSRYPVRIVVESLDDLPLSGTAHA